MWKKWIPVLFKVQGGPNTTILMDVVKNPYILLSEEYQEIYSFHLSDVITIDDRLHYVVGFRQNEYVDDPFYKGKLYIDMDKLAISEAEFEVKRGESGRGCQDVYPAKAHEHEHYP